MKQFWIRLTAVLLALVISLTPVSAATIENDEDTSIPIDFLMDADCAIETLPSGEKIVVLSSTKQLLSASNENRFAATTYSIYPDVEEDAEKILTEIHTVKRECATRGSGQYTDDEWFHGQSLHLESTVYYSTTHSGGLTYGKITSVYVKYSVLNSTVVDSLSLHIQQVGFLLGGGRDQFDKIVTISNRSTTTTPSSWEYILWDGSSGSFAGALVTATVHRGTSEQKSYPFPNNLL